MTEVSQISQLFSLIFLFMQLPRSVIFNSPGHDMTLALGSSIKADREKAFLQSLIIMSWFLLMKNWPRTSGVGVIKNWRGTISWGRGMEINWGRVKVVSRCYKTLWAPHHISPILCQIRENLQYALLITRPVYWCT